MGALISNRSLAQNVAALSKEDRDRILAKLTKDQSEELLYDWKFWARPNQLAPPGNWMTWLALAGRGYGKTEAGAQWVRDEVAKETHTIALVAETQKDLEEVMVRRLISIYPPDEAPIVRYKPVRLVWPNGSVAYGYNGTEPNQLRGPQFSLAWVDELAKYRYARELWDMLMFTMRSGTNPRVFVTTTPRPIPVLREIIKDPTTTVTHGSTFDNAGNLPAQFLEKLKARYAGTRLGRQELNAEILDDTPGALWDRDVIEKANAKRTIPDMKRVVVAVDPSGTRGENEDDGDAIGIVVAGKGVDGRAYVLADRTCKLSPNGWARRAVDAYRVFQADRIVAETNYGGAMVESTIRTADPKVPYTEVKASRGKVIRAEPVAALYEQCVAAGTLIACERGQIPIEAVREGDRVWTRAGLKPVLWAGQTGVQKTIQIEASGKILRLTENHPVLTTDGWIHAGQLAHKERTVFAWRSNANFVKRPLAFEKVERSVDRAARFDDGRTTLDRLRGLLSSLKGCATIDSQTAIGGPLAMAGMNSCIEPSGNRIIKSRSLMDGMSITETKIQGITTLKTYLRCLTENILDTITRMASRPLDGQRSAPNAKKIFSRFGVGNGYAPTSVDVCDTPERSESVEPVFNLHVADQHEYVANGILVHNCRVSHVQPFDELEDEMCQMTRDGFTGEGSPNRVDALVWALTELMLDEQKREIRFTPEAIQRLAPSKPNRFAIGRRR
jgi:phage terminase large subunit-like protein